MHPLLVLAGPTASGKSTLALALADQLGGEILSCDSVAVYRGMDIGAAKPSAADRERIPHHLLDLVNPDQPFTAGDWARHARSALAGTISRGRLPIIAGGTGLYLRALLDGLFPAPPADPHLRDRLRHRAARTGPARLHRLLRRFDPAAAHRIHPNDTPKLLRALEVSLAARSPITAQWQTGGRDALTGFRTLRITLDPPRNLLRNRIDLRAKHMFDQGLLDETRHLLDQFAPGWHTPIPDESAAIPSQITHLFPEIPRSFGALGYAQSVAVLRGTLSLPAAITAAQAGHRQLSKRQGTWFRKEAALHPTTVLPLFGDDPVALLAASRLLQQHTS